MTGPRRTYTWPCPECGREVTGTAAYMVRHARPCLGCTRRQTGWQHQSGCTQPADHRGVCFPV